MVPRDEDEEAPQVEENVASTEHGPQKLGKDVKSRFVYRLSIHYMKRGNTRELAEQMITQ